MRWERGKEELFRKLLRKKRKGLYVSTLGKRKC